MSDGFKKQIRAGGMDDHLPLAKRARRAFPDENDGDCFVLVFRGPPTLADMTPTFRELLGHDMITSDRRGRLLGACGAFEICYDGAAPVICHGRAVGPPDDIAAFEVESGILSGGAGPPIGFALLVQNRGGQVRVVCVGDLIGDPIGDPDRGEGGFRARVTNYQGVSSNCAVVVYAAQINDQAVGSAAATRRKRGDSATEQMVRSALLEVLNQLEGGGCEAKK